MLIERRSFLAWLGLAPLAASLPKEPRKITRTTGPGCYLVQAAIPELEVRVGDHVIVRTSHIGLHRYLGPRDLSILEACGDLMFVRELTPTPVPAGRGDGVRTGRRHGRSRLRLVREGAD